MLFLPCSVFQELQTVTLLSISPVNPDEPSQSRVAMRKSSIYPQGGVSNFSLYSLGHQVDQMSAALLSAH